jgi:hypothetical protein
MALKRILILLSTLIILFSVWILGGEYLKPIPALAGSAKEIHGSRETEAHIDEAHREKEDHEVEGHAEEAAHGEEEHGEESWWRFPAWQIVFAGIGCFYFVLVLAWLPKLVAKKGTGGGH